MDWAAAVRCRLLLLLVLLLDCSAGVIDSGLTVVPTQLLQTIKASLLISPIDGEACILPIGNAGDIMGGMLECHILVWLCELLCLLGNCVNPVWPISYHEFS